VRDEGGNDGRRRSRGGAERQSALSISMDRKWQCPLLRAGEGNSPRLSALPFSVLGAGNGNAGQLAEDTGQTRLWKMRGLKRRRRTKGQGSGRH